MVVQCDVLTLTLLSAIKCCTRDMSEGVTFEATFILMNKYGSIWMKKSTYFVMYMFWQIIQEIEHDILNNLFKLIFHLVIQIQQLRIESVKMDCIDNPNSIVRHILLQITNGQNHYCK